jgi:hypothetical protein
MTKVLQYLADQTNGITYKSHRFCFDAELNLPSLTYDDDKGFISI